MCFYRYALMSKTLVAISCLFFILSACGGESSTSSDPSTDSSADTEISSSDKESSSSSSNNESSETTKSSNSNNGNSSSKEDDLSSSSKQQQKDKSSSSSVSIADQKIPCDTLQHGIWVIGSEEFVCKDGFLVPYVPPSSSSAKVLPFKEKFKIDSVFNEEKTYGTFEDPRDGQIYRTIVIKTKSATSPEFEVFAQNLNYGSQVNLGASVFDDNKVEKFCYDDDPWYCDNYFGGLYSWSETFGLPRACDSVWTGSTSNCPDPIATGIDSDFDWDYLQIQGICPEGWHVMNENEWRAMIRGDESAYRATSKASKGSNGNGFSALYGGGAFCDENGCKYRGLDERAHYWYPHELSDFGAKNIDLYKSEVDKGSKYYKFYGLPIRCVKDYSFTI